MNDLSIFFLSQCRLFSSLYIACIFSIDGIVWKGTWKLLMQGKCCHLNGIPYVPTISAVTPDLLDSFIFLQLRKQLSKLQGEIFQNFKEVM
jgi:hypothetical protein